MSDFHHAYHNLIDIIRWATKKAENISLGEGGGGASEPKDQHQSTPAIGM